QPVVTGQMLTDWASQAKKVGIDIVLKSDTFNHIISIADDVGSPKTANDWAMADYGGFTNTAYPTTFGIFNTGGSFNGGAREDAQNHQPINASGTRGHPPAGESEAPPPPPPQPPPLPPHPPLLRPWEDHRPPH